MGLRIGHGYDAHRLIDGRPLILCGEHVVFEKGLEGHSDSDIGAHAAIDALLGAAALGDIGAMFPETDMRFHNADSVHLLKLAAERVYAAGFSLGNIDITIIAQNPSLAAHINDMRGNIARALATDIGNVSVKSTTEEGMGFTGVGDGMAAHAVVIINK